MYYFVVRLSFLYPQPGLCFVLSPALRSLHHSSLEEPISTKISTMSSISHEWEQYADSDSKDKRFTCISKLPAFIGKVAPSVFGVVTAVKEPTKSKGGDGGEDE